MVTDLQDRPSRGGDREPPGLALKTRARWQGAVAAGALYFLASWLFFSLAADVSHFWLPAGLAVGLLVLLAPALRLPAAAAIVLAGLMASALAGRTGFAPALFSVTDAVQALIISALIAGYFPPPFALDRFRAVLGFSGAVAIGTVCCQAVVALIAHLTSSTASYLALWSELLWANIAGVMIVAPLPIAISAAIRQPQSLRSLIEGAAVLAAHMMFCAEAFALLPLELGSWARLSPFMSQMPLLLWLALRGGPLFAAAGSFVLGLSVTASWMLGRGPFLETDFSVHERLVAMQLGLFVAIFVGLALAAHIAELAEAERIANHGRSWLKLSLDAGRTGLWEFDPKSGEFAVMKGESLDLGFPDSVCSSLADFTSALHPEDRALWQAHLAQAYKGESKIEVECRMLDGKGGFRWLHVTGGMTGSQSAPRFAGTVRDVTELKAVASLRENMEHLRHFVEQAPVAIAMFDQHMRYVAVSREWRESYGRERRFIGEYYYDVFPEAPLHWREVNKRCLAGETIRNERESVTLANGRVLWLSWETRPWYDGSGNIGGIVIVAHDITSSIKAQQALVKSREDLNRAQAVAKVGSARIDVSKKESVWSDEAFRILGVPYSEHLSHRDVLALIHPADRERVEKDWKAALAGKPFDGEYRILSGEDMKWIHIRAELELDRNGQATGGFGTMQDITRKRRAEEALRQSEERNRAILDTAVDAIIVIDDAGLVVSINPAGERMFGYAESELKGKNVSLLMKAADRKGHEKYIDAYRRTGKAKVIGIGRGTEGQRKDGSVFDVEIAVAEWKIEGKHYFTGIIRDISERKHQERQVALLLREVNHRAKNMLALVQAIAAQTAPPEGGEFLMRFSERLAALAASQDLLVSSEWQGVEVSELLRSQLSHFKGLLNLRINLSGPALHFSATGAQSIGMAVHELATNAGKYGALSNDTGVIEIAWRLDGDASQFSLDWIETGGPIVHQPARSGFGTTVIEAMPRLELDARISLTYRPEGLHWSLACPVERVLETSACSPSRPRGPFSQRHGHVLKPIGLGGPEPE